MATEAHSKNVALMAFLLLCLTSPDVMGSRERKLSATISEGTLPPDASFRDAIPSKESKIIGGSQISINDAKYQVSLRLVANENARGFGYGHICGGSIISQRVILTAAHCLINYNTDPETERRAGEFKVVVGSTQLYVKEPNVLEYYVQEMVKHAGFDPISMINDIALVMINGYIPWNWPTARAIHLNDIELNMGAPCNVSGWGKTERGLIPNNLMSTVVRSISYNDCEASYGHIPLSMICAGDYYVGGVDACQGDSGGPMVCANSQVGIVSWGIGCGQALKPVCAPPSNIFGIGRLQDPRIINGTEATLANTKHQVSIRRRINDDYYFGMGHICGGSLISENVVLCAGHCFTDQEAFDGSYLPDDEFFVTMGNLDRFEQNNNTLKFDIKKIEKHRPVFNFSTYEDDIVVIILNGTVPADHPTVQPIVLNDGELKNGTVCQVTGWGITEEGYNSDVLMTVDVPYIPPNVCRKESAYLDLIRPGMMCAGYLEGERDACQGDSGGPLVCNNRQAGITSWGSGCALPLKPGVYTDVAFYKDWILQKIAENNGTLPKFAVCAPPSDIFGIGRPQDPRIINGTVATLANTKHQVSIRRRLNDGYFFGTGHICGGSLISENVVLCAGHCFT
ncbi:polyserase-2-like, partial [Musca vetustissima]|uniref:polyserase-2-like n=1 Tax=Musca vetustissima TaxID=27455 RepID=UPI002AB715EF